MTTKTNCILISFLLLLQLNIKAQLPEYHVRLITDQQGLNTSDILDLAKDQKGFLWLLSLSSVQRYDGRQAKSFLFEETVKNVFIDNKDRKWVLGSRTAHLFKNEYDGFKRIEIAGEKAPSTVALFNSDEQLYLLLSTGIWKYDERIQQFIPFKRELFSGRILPAIFSNPGNYIFFGSNDSIYRVNMRSFERHVIAFKSIAYMMAVNDSALLVSDWNSRSYKISFTDNSIREIFANQVSNAPPNDFIRFFGAAALPGGRFFLSSNIGIVEYNSKSGRLHMPDIYNRGRPLSNNTSVKTFYRDKSGSIFMTHADGLAFFDPAAPGMNYIREYSCDGGYIPDIDVRCFAEDNAGHTWLGTINGIARLNMTTGEVKNFWPSKSGSNNYPTIRDILFFDKYIIAGTGSKGVWILNTISNEFRRPVFTNDPAGRQTAQLLNDDFIWRLVHLKSGNILIVGAKYSYELNPNSFVTRIVNVLPDGSSRSAAQDQSERIWQGTSRGLYCYDKNMRPLFAIKDSFSDKRIASFCEWKKDHMLIGGKGIFEAIVKNNRIQRFKKIDILPPGRFVFCMQQDAMGNVWMGTDEGLYCYNPIKESIESYDAADNVQPQAFNSNGLYLANKKWIFAGGKTGFNYFDPAVLQKKISVLHPLVSSFSVGNNDSLFFKAAPPYLISYFNRSIIINVSVPEYLRPFSLQYRYRLNANDTNWIDNGNSNSIRMHNLPYGKYSFEAAASYDGKNWFPTTDKIGFTILKPWWHQWWFRLLVLTGMMAAFWLVTRYRKNKRTNKTYEDTIDYFANSGHEHSSTDDILWDITRNCISRLGFKDCVIYLVDEERQVLRQRAAYGTKSPRSKEIINPIEIKMGEGITGYAAANAQAVLVRDTRKDKRYIVDDETRFSELAVPIIHKEKVIGVIDSEHPQKNFFTQKHLDTLQRIAGICASKISLSIAVEKMQHAIRQVDEVNTKMLETKFMNLRLQMNPHFLFNSLSSIQHLIVSQQTNEAYKYLSIFSSFLRSILQYADKTVITLEDELKMLGMYIKLESIGFDESFSYDIKVDDDLETEDIFIPPLILQPLVENAIWHGLLHKKGKKHFSVQLLNNNDDHLLCIIEDNGVGRQEAGSIKEKNLHTSNYQSKATGLIKERLQLLKQTTGKEASITTEDLLKDAKPAGTRITIIIPYYNNEDA